MFGRAWIGHGGNQSLGGVEGYYPTRPLLGRGGSFVRKRGSSDTRSPSRTTPSDPNNTLPRIQNIPEEEGVRSEEAQRCETNQLLSCSPSFLCSFAVHSVYYPPVISFAVFAPFRSFTCISSSAVFRSLHFPLAVLLNLGSSSTSRTRIKFYRG